jgi:predicted nucleic acid-binding protein
MPEVVFDCRVISNFALTDTLGILEELYKNKASMSDFAGAEVLRGIQAGHSRLKAIPEAVRSGWLRETGLRPRNEKSIFESLSRSLGLGEASSIAVAKCRASVFASDDPVAGAEADGLGITLTGTLGILVKAVRTDVCDLGTADRHLERMIEAGFFSPVRSLREIVR